MVVAPTLLQKPSTPVKLSGRGKIKTSNDYMKNRKWSGLTSMLLESHIDGHVVITSFNFFLPDSLTCVLGFCRKVGATTIHPSIYITEAINCSSIF